MSRKIIARVLPDVSFGWTFRPGKPAAPSVTVDSETAAKLRLSGTVAKDGSVTTRAKDATPRAVVLTNAKQLTATHPTGTVPASGVAISAEAWREIIAQHGWKTIGAMFPQDGSDPSPEARAALDPAEVESMTDYLRMLVTLDDIEEDGANATL